MNGSYSNSDMEVDEKLQIISEKNANFIIKQESLEYPYAIQKNENEYLTVINNFQNMKESECTQVNNSFNCVSCKDNIDVKQDINVEMVANGGLVNCLGGSNSTGPKKLDSLHGDAYNVIDSNLLESKIKKEDVCYCTEVNGTDVFNMCQVKGNELIGSEPNEKVLKEENNSDTSDLKSGECNLATDKIRSKDHNGSSLSCNSTSSSSSATTLTTTTIVTVATAQKEEPSLSHHSSSSSKSRYKEYKSSSHRSSSSSKNCSDRSRETDKSKYESSDKKKSRSCHHKSDEKCHCKSRHHSRHHSKSKKFQSVKTQCTADEIAYELGSNKTVISNPYFTRVPWVPYPQINNMKYGRFYRIETDRNGGATTCHLYMDEISHLSESQMKECAVEFIKLSYSEDENECAYHVMGIVHGAASYLPDLVDYMADHYPTLTVKTGSLASRDNHTTTMSQYRDEVYKTYSNGTFRYAPLDQLSICGVLGEEVGAYFPDFVARLEQSPFMKPVMPWSSLSVVETDNPRESNDGPIFWVRPGEQMLPANEALKESARPKKRRNNELDNLAYIAGSRSSEARESLFMDRTKAHADQVGVDYGLSNTAPTAAVGVLKSVNCGHPEHGNRATKDVVAFHAQDYNELLEILMLDLYEPPQTQCTKWIEVSKLNTLRREGIRYAHIQLHDNDVYYLPRKIIHQFQTISSVASVAWHIRYKDYFSIMGAPNLHTPTGINKGQVFYEKKNVAVYYPPVCENELLASVTHPDSPLPKTPKKYDRLKDYSPFKHSPRKNHKISSPRVSSKKGSDLVPQTPDKKDLESNDEEKKSNSVKKDHVKADDSSEISPKREREGSSKKSDSSGHMPSDHPSTKRERKESHESSHRKEVKNLESEFDCKKSKSKSTKSEKSTGHDGRRKSDEGSSRHKRHDDSKSKSHSKHEKSSSHRKESASNGPVSESSLKNDEKNEKSVSLKRKNSDSQESCSSKKVKDESCQKETENGVTNASIVAVESDVEMCGSNAVFNGDLSSSKDASTGNDNAVCVGSENRVDASLVPCDSNEKTALTPETEDDNLVSNPGNDLKQFGNVSCVKSDINPPLPCSSPPANPPLPPNSPTSDASLCAASNENEEVPRKEESTSANEAPSTGNRDPQEQSNTSKDKDVFQGKKVKKKIMKKVLKEESESYDLLGDIMSQMDKKK